MSQHSGSVKFPIPLCCETVVLSSCCLQYTLTTIHSNRCVLFVVTLCCEYVAVVLWIFEGKSAHMGHHIQNRDFYVSTCSVQFCHQQLLVDIIYLTVLHIAVFVYMQNSNLTDI